MIGLTPLVANYFVAKISSQIISSQRFRRKLFSKIDLVYTDFVAKISSQNKKKMGPTRDFPGCHNVQSAPNSITINYKDITKNALKRAMVIYLKNFNNGTH